MARDLIIPSDRATQLTAGARAALAVVRPWLGLTVAFLVGYTLLYLALLWGGYGGEQGAMLLSDFGMIPIEVLGLYLALRVVSREPRPRARNAWALIALAIGVNLTADIVYGAYELAGETPFPSFADLFYIAFYPLLFAGLLALPTASRRSDLLAWRVWSNVAIVLLAGSMAVLHFILLPAIAELPEDPTAILVSLAYPIGDLALLAALATIATRRPFAVDRAAIAFLIVLVVAWFLADLAFTIVTADDAYTYGGISDLLWLAGDIAVVLAAKGQLVNLPRPDASLPTPAPSIGRVGAYLMLGLGLVTLMAAAFKTQTEMAMLAILSVTLTAVVVARQLADEHERRRAEAALLAAQAAEAAREAEAARRDHLTGLPNRAAFHEVLAAEMSASLYGGHELSLAFVDLDRFKVVNDTLGHQAGDQLLREVGARLRSCVRVGDTVARMGGDEFAIVLPGAAADPALRIAGQARELVERPVLIGGVSATVGAAIGVVTHPGSRAQDGDDLLHQADRAMYAAKRAGDGPVAWEPALEDETDDPSASEALAAPAQSWALGGT